MPRTRSLAQRSQPEDLSSAKIQLTRLLRNALESEPHKWSDAELAALRAHLSVKTPAHDSDSIRAIIRTEFSSGPLKRHHKRHNHEDYIRRPSNAFILFRNAQILDMSNSDRQATFSVLVGKMWRTLTHSERATWYSLAADVKRVHRTLHPHYVYKSPLFRGPLPPGSKKATVSQDQLELAQREIDAFLEKHAIMVPFLPGPPCSCTFKLPAEYKRQSCVKDTRSGQTLPQKVIQPQEQVSNEVAPRLWSSEYQWSS